MRIFGVDFTSAPRHGKPIACASAVLESDSLHVHCLASLASLDTFENFLNSQGPWVARLDFPFGQPRRLLENLGWPMSWEGYVERSASLGMDGFEEVLREYREQSPSSDKQHCRHVDVAADARSPMTMVKAPVGRMFLHGAPFLRRSNVSVLPCRPRTDERVVLEAYLALVARRLIGKTRYKADTNVENPHLLADARRELVDGLMARSLKDEFGIRIVIDRTIREAFIEQTSADSLDSVLCALQAAWSWTRREQGWGIPSQVDPLEGWIVDPALGALPPEAVPVSH
jgi:hypothetical protein